MTDKGLEGNSGREFRPEDVDLSKEPDALILGASAYRNMAPYFAYLAKHLDKPIANLRSRYNYLRRRAEASLIRRERRGRPRKVHLGSEGDIIQLFGEVFRVKPSRAAVSVLRDCVAQYGALRVAMAMERVRPEGGEVFARAIAAELGLKNSG